jgi:hypothetical protein
LVRLWPRKENAVWSWVDAHQDDVHTARPTRGDESRGARDDISGGVRHGLPGRNATLKVDEDERGGRVV